MATYCKFYKEQQYVSYDSGVTWSATSETRKGDLIERDSVDCGWTPIEPVFRYVTGSPYCQVGSNDMVMNIDYQASYDEEETWVTIGTTIKIVEKNSLDCGYTPVPQPCSPTERKYEFNQLNTMVYLLGEHDVDIYIDGEDAYLNGLSGTPLALRVYDVNFEEEDALDERYTFAKSVKFKVHGYADKSIFDDKYYIVIEDKNERQWLVNVDFPSEVSYVFNLGTNISETEFTFKSLSNYPALRLQGHISNGINVCYNYHSNGIKQLEILESNLCKLDRASKMVYTQEFEEFQNVKYIKNSISLQESYSNDEITTTLQFNLPLDNAWYYTMLQFPANKYSCIIKTNDDENTFFCGFNFGLQPSYKVSASSKKGEQNFVTITLTETSHLGIVALDEWTQQDKSLNHWVSVRSTDEYDKTWECYGNGIARYLVEEEVDAFGQSTNRYRVLSGYVSQFPLLNIVGQFTDFKTFNEPSCKIIECGMDGTLPTSIAFTSDTCYTYTVSASCDWNVQTKPSWISITPSGGSANVQYTLSVCAIQTPTDTDKSGIISMKIGDLIRLIGVSLKKEKYGLWPASKSINCLSQKVQFNFNPSHHLTLTVPSGLTYVWEASTVSFNVPRNEATSAKTWLIGVNDTSAGGSQIVTIIQDKTYENWVTVQGSVICEGTTSYQKLRRYTGLTSTTTITPTNEYKKGSIISTEDTACGVAYKTVWEPPYCNAYYEYVQDYTEYISYNYGTTWEVYWRGYKVLERNSERCGYTPPTAGTKVSLIYNGDQVDVQCEGGGALTTGDTHPSGKQISDLISAAIGACVTSIGEAAFSGATSMASVLWEEGRNVASVGASAFTSCESMTIGTIPSGVTEIGEYAYAHCESMTAVEIPSEITDIKSHTFAWCYDLVSATLPKGTTSIGESAFEHCSSLDHITIKATTPPTLGLNALNDTNNCEIRVPLQSVPTYKSASGWSTYASRITSI